MGYPNVLDTGSPALAGVIVCPSVIYKQEKYFAWMNTGVITYTNPTTQRTSIVTYGSRDSPAIETLLGPGYVNAQSGDQYPYVDIDGNPFPECQDDLGNPSGRCARVRNFNCP